MNTAILTYRFRQLWKIVREIPLPYLLILAAMLAALVAGLNVYAAESQGGWVITAGVLLLLAVLHTRRKDYRFMFHVEVKPWRVFAVEYLLLALPVLLIEWVQGRWSASFVLAVGCVGIAFFHQPAQLAGKGMPVPSWIPYGLFEFRSAFRRYGVGLLLLYVAACVSLLVPYLPLAFLFIYTCSLVECYRLSEPLPVLCARELAAGAFLHRKLYENACAYFLTMLPPCAIYAVLHQEQAWFAVFFLLAGTLINGLMIVTKYAYYRPQAKIVAGQLSLLLSLAGMIALFLFPVTLFFFVKNYLAARRNLTTWLYAYNP